MQTTVPGGWTLRAVGGPVPPPLADVLSRAVPATVPGCVHTDLLAAGLIPDPYLDLNEPDLEWIGRVDWRYEAELDWPGVESGPPPGEQVELVAQGLDTVATVEVNGAEVARTRNMHRTYRIPVALRPGRNVLAVTFAAGRTAAEQDSARLGPRPHVNVHPYNALRKMACNFGWDWGPDLVTAGIWRPLTMQSWSGARIAAVRPLVSVDGVTGQVTVHATVQRAPGQDLPLVLRAEVGGMAAQTVLVAGDSAGTLEVRVPDVRLWWPHGYGEQPLYPVTVTLAGDGVADRWAGRVGFRTVRLDTAPDERGSRFALEVNGVPVFARGVNWIPDDCFPSRVGRPRYAARLAQARDANANLVRVWGGGVYESDEFYDTCDELGLLVWQDFAFACAAYAEEEPLRGEVAAEAREAVTRLSRHPSLVLWNGGNENLWGWHDWGWAEPLAGRSWGLGYYTQLLPAVVAELDPTRPYIPGSPYSPGAGVHPNDPDHGTMHVWDVWNERDYGGYRGHVPRFVAEFGFQGPPTWATLTRAVHDAPLTPDSPGMALHQKAEDGAGKLARGLAGHLPVPGSVEDWHWATQLNQARAVALGVEHFRSWTPVCMGAVVWQLNDCWPVVSWAAVDGDGRRKPLWYALRRSFRDRLLTVQPRGGGLALVAVNDTDRRWQGDVAVSRRGLSGEVLAAAVVPLAVPPRGARTIPVPAAVAVAGDPRREVLLAEGGGDRAWWAFAEDVAADLPAQELSVEVARVAGGYRLAVTARAFVRDLAVLADRLAPDAVVDDMLHTLLPGETATVTVRTAAELPAAALTDPLVLRSANQLVTVAEPGRSGGPA